MNSRLTLKPKLFKKTIVADEKVEDNGTYARGSGAARIDGWL